MQWKEMYLESERERRDLAQRVVGLETELRALRGNHTPTREPVKTGKVAGEVPLGSPASVPDSSAQPATEPVVLGDWLYRQILDRLLQDLPEHPTALRILANRPEITVELKKQTVTLDGKTLRGRLAQLLAENFFDSGANGNKAFNELQKRGFSTAKPNVYRELDTLTEMGFLLKLETGYQAVAGMKVNLVEVA